MNFCLRISFLVQFAAWSIAVMFPLLAQEEALSLLLHPERALNPSSTASSEDATLAPQVNGSPLSFTGSPAILIFKNSDLTTFVSAVWKDRQSNPLHQRSVFVIKSRYAVCVDYLQVPYPQNVVRNFSFESGTPVAITHGAFVNTGSQIFCLQVSDPASSGLSTSVTPHAVHFTTSAAQPAPLTTVLLTARGTPLPRIDYVKPANPMIVKFTVTYPSGQVDHVALAWESRSLHVEGKEFKGWAACLSQGTGETSSLVVN